MLRKMHKALTFSIIYCANCHSVFLIKQIEHTIKNTKRDEQKSFANGAKY